jgi:hypothetical protein
MGQCKDGLSCWGQLWVALYCRMGHYAGRASLWPHVQPCVDAVVREWLQQVLGDDTAQGGLGEAARNQAIVFFVNNRLVMARYPEWLQSSFTIPVNLFERIGLLTNAAKMKVMMCLLGKIRVARTEEEYAAQQTGNATTSKRWRIDCKVCGISLAAESL